MTDRRPAPNRPADPVDRWEAVFADGLVAAERPAPWVDGAVHVVRGLPDQPEPIPTGGLDYHQVLVSLAPISVTEGVQGGAPYTDESWAPGKVFVASRDLARSDTRTAWRALSDDGYCAVSVLVPPAAVAAAGRAAGLDYAATEFRDRPSATDPVLDALVRRLGAEAERGGPSGRLYAETLLAAVAAHLVADHAEGGRRPSTGGLPASALRRARDLAASRLADPDLSMDELAGAAGYSPWHFARAFREATGESPAEHVTRLRMDGAARLLTDPARAHWSVAAVAAEVGYQSPSAFAKAFRRRCGFSPAAYRRETQR